MSTLRRFLLVIGTVIPAYAQLPSPHLRSIHPTGSKIGTTVEVTIAGTDLDETSGLLFSHPDIKAERVMVPATEFRPEHPNPTRFRITVANGVPPGRYEVHAQTRLGLSSSRPFVVGTNNEIAEPGTNKEISGALELSLGTIVNARADGDSVDYFRFKAKQGQRLLIQCWAERIASKMDATIAIDDSAGRELLSDRDTLGRDPVLNFVAPADGVYFLRVYDFTFGGGDEFYYRLQVSNAPHIDFIVPPAGKPGTKSRYKIYGRNLPGGSKGEGVRLGPHELESVEVEIQLPAESQTAAFSTPVRQALLPGFDFQLTANGASSNPIRIGFSTEPVVAEIESPADQVVTIPTEVHGTFAGPGDNDRLLFEATKGAPLWIECIAERLGKTSDPLLIIEHQKIDEKGSKQFSEIQSNDDDNNPGGRLFPIPTRDPALRFTPPADGTYRITLLNQSGRGGPASQYRLIIREHQPDFDLVATAWKPHRDSKVLQPVPSLLRQGGTAALQVLASRKDGFNDEIIIDVNNLPDGVTCPSVRIPAGKNSTTLVLTSTDDAPEWSGFITVNGKAGDQVHAARAGVISWGVANYETERTRPHLTTRLPLSVCTAEKAPLVISTEAKPEWEVALGGKLNIPIKLLKKNAIKGDFTISPEGFLFVKNPPQLKIKEADSEGTLSINFTKNANFPVEPGVWQFVLRGDGIVKYRNNPAASARADTEQKRITDLKAQLDKQAKDARAAVQPSQQALKKAEQDLKTASAEAKPPLQAAVDKARSDYQTKEQAAKDAEAKAKRVENERKAAENRAKVAREKAKERDVKISTYSLPITVRVTAPPPPKEETPK